MERGLRAKCCEKVNPTSSVRLGDVFWFRGKQVVENHKFGARARRAYDFNTFWGPEVYLRL